VEAVLDRLILFNKIMHMGKIVFENLEFYAYHGLMQEEQKIGAKYLLSLEIELDFSIAIATDELAGTIDYSLVYDLVKTEMEKQSKLIEHVGGRIVSMLFVTFKQIEHITLKLTKLKPPISGNVNAVSVVIEKSRL
jgi:7,8-dihydroneopterin aldolase/epimerase/oxygenase